MSIAGCATSACQSSPTCVVPVLQRVVEASARACARRPSPRGRGCDRAPSGDRSAMPTRCTPGVRGTCARYIAPNLPAPIRPTRSGLPSAARCWSLACRLMSGRHLQLVGRGLERARRRAVLPRQVDRVVASAGNRRAGISIGVKSRCAMYSGRLKRRMWLETAHRLRYTLTRFHGERFDVDACTRQPWNRIIEPAGPFGATMPPSWPAPTSLRDQRRCRWSTADSWWSSCRARRRARPACGCRE